VSQARHIIAELIRAANELERLSADERSRLVEDAITLIQHLRLIARRAIDAGASDPLFELHFIAAAIPIGWATDDRLRAAFLRAATIIRDLRRDIDQNANEEQE